VDALSYGDADALPQALAEVASEKDSTISFPLPIELLAPFLKLGRDGASAAAQTNGRPEDASLG
jgi:hypothetical protein